MATITYALENFVNDVTQCIEKNPEDRKRVAAAEKYLSRLIADTSWLSMDRQQPRDNGYARHSLYLDPKNRFEVLALVWKPGQGTCIHDHDGTWGVEGVLLGKIKVCNYLCEGNVAADKVKLKFTDTLIAQRGTTGVLLPPADCHTIECCGTSTAITVHVYGKQLRKFRVFEPSSEQGIFKTYEKHIQYS